MSDLVLRSVSKRYGNSKTLAVDGVSLEIEKGELVCLLGPSGCGKTTLLRIIAGFVEPTAGSVIVRGQDVTDVSPNKRNMGMVFQNYALFPHMTVRSNVEYGLRMRRVPKAEAAARVEKILDMVGLLELEGRYPRQLSGGQQQRVALARAMVILPQLLLFDEPLSNLDAKLRQQMRVEIRRIQKEVGITSIFVTHDQEEGLTISDRIAVMNAGRIEQIGSPQGVYDQPQTRFVANFIGACNFFEGKVASRQGSSDSTSVVTDTGLEILAAGGPLDATKGTRICAAVRPEFVSLSAESGETTSSLLPNRNAFRGSIQHISRLGSVVEYHVSLFSGDRVRTQEQAAQSSHNVEVGSRVVVSWDAERTMCFSR